MRIFSSKKEEENINLLDFVFFSSLSSFLPSKRILCSVLESVSGPEFSTKGESSLLEMWKIETKFMETPVSGIVNHIDFNFLKNCAKFPTATRTTLEETATGTPNIVKSISVKMSLWVVNWIEIYCTTFVLIALEIKLKSSPIALTCLRFSVIERFPNADNS